MTEANELTVIEKEVPNIVKLATDLEITPANIDATNRWMQEAILGSIKKIKAFFDPDIDAANKVHKQLCAKRRMFLDPLEEAETITRLKVERFLEVEKRRREEEERKLREQAEKDAEKERKKISLLLVWKEKFHEVLSKENCPPDQAHKDYDLK